MNKYISKKNKYRLLIAVIVLAFSLIYIDSTNIRQFYYPYALLLLPMIVITRIRPSWTIAIGLTILLTIYRLLDPILSFGTLYFILNFAEIISSNIIFAIIYLLVAKYQIDYDKKIQEAFDQIFEDPLTGARNRRYLTKYLESFDDYELDFSVIMFDIDRFKLINDNFGHSVGDQILYDIHELVKRKIRDTDSVVRLGGEEFALLLSDTNLSSAFTTAERIRTAVELHPFEYGNRTIAVTISVGVAQRLPDETKEELMERADTALYESKRNGRNRTTVA